MPALRELQRAFLGHLLGDTTDIAHAIQSTPEASASERLSIYATGYRLRLKEALETDYPRLHTYLGDALFDRLAGAYIDRYRSQGTSLRGYSRHMGELLAGLSPFDELPVLGELERIERAFNHSFDAADSGPLDPAVLERLPPAAWPDMRLGVHASLRLLDLRFNSFAIWRALAEEQTPPEPEPDRAIWVIWRRALVSRYRALPAHEADLLRGVLAGEPLADLCERLLAHFPADEVPGQAVGLLRGWIGEEMITHLETTPPD